MRFADSSIESAFGFLTSNLAHIEAEVYAIEYPEYKYSKFVPIDDTAPAYSPQIVRRVIDYRGGLKPRSPYGTDVPTSDVSQKAEFKDIHTFQNGYQFTIEELEQARLGMITLDTERAQAVRATSEASTNQIMLLGALKDDDGVTDLALVGEGLFTSPSVPVSTSAGKIEDIVAAGGEKMAQAVLNVFNAAYNNVYINQTKTVHKPNTFAMPSSTLRLLGSTLLGPNNGSNFTLLQFLKANYPDVDFDDDIQLEHAGTAGARRLICYKKDKRIVRGHMPMPLTFQAIEGPNNMAFYVPAMCRTGGVEWRVPKAANYVDGI